MTQGIHISSLEALRDFQTSLALYRHEAEETLDKVEMEAPQALGDVEDALSAALQQTENCRDELAQARDDLSDCQGGYSDEDDDEPDCTAEEEALADSEEALREAEERVETLQDARNRLEQVVEAFRSQARCLKEFLEIDLMHADSTLAAKIDAIETYLAVAVPGTPSLAVSSLKTGSEHGPKAVLNPLTLNAAPTGPLYQNPSRVVTTRVGELQAAIPPDTRGHITMAAAVVENPNGVRSVLIGTSEPRGYLRRGVTVKPGEAVVAGPLGTHAEEDIIAHAQAKNLRVIDIGATWRVCERCQDLINPTGANTSTPLKPRREDGADAGEKSP